MIVLGFIAVIAGHDLAGGALATTSVVALASVFVYGSLSQRREREAKAEIAEKIKASQSPPDVDLPAASPKTSERGDFG